MRVIDVDAHFHEPKDWLKVTDPKLDEEVGPIQHMKVAMRGFWYANPLLASLPDEESRRQMMRPCRRDLPNTWI